MRVFLAYSKIQTRLWRLWYASSVSGEMGFGQDLCDNPYDGVICGVVLAR
jgi:hypothetical protein